MVEWDLSSTQESMITASVFLGELLGTLIWGPVSDKFGRKNAFAFSCGIVVISGILSAISPNYIALIVFRFFFKINYYL